MRVVFKPTDGGPPVPMFTPRIALPRGTYRLGIDIGGTFTDTVLVNEGTGQVHVLKVPSNRREPWKAGAALQRVSRDHGVDPASIRYFVHGTTLATNTIIERSGATPAC